MKPGKTIPLLHTRLQPPLPQCAMYADNSSLPWGLSPWVIDFSPPRQPLPSAVDVAVVGGGFTGLAAAAWLRLHDPGKTVVVLESGSIGTGASGHTGGMALAPRRLLETCRAWETFWRA